MGWLRPGPSTFGSAILGRPEGLTDAAQNERAFSVDAAVVDVADVDAADVGYAAAGGVCSP